MKVRWTEEEIQELKKLYKEGLKYEEIGKIIGRTYDSVRVKLSRFGLKYTDIVSGKENIKCLECKREIIANISDHRKFCNNSCSVTYSNRINPRIKKKK